MSHSRHPLRDSIAAVRKMRESRKPRPQAASAPEPELSSTGGTFTPGCGCTCVRRAEDELPPSHITLRLHAADDPFMELELSGAWIGNVTKGAEDDLGPYFDVRLRPSRHYESRFRAEPKSAVNCREGRGADSDRQDRSINVDNRRR